MSKLQFLLAENPMLPEQGEFIFHVQNPPMLIEVHHESIGFGDEKMFLTGNYQNTDGFIETHTLSVYALLICEPVLTDEMKRKVDSVLKRAWRWYVAYMKWEDDNIDLDNYANEN